jgi:hypothetical protein
MPFRFTPLERAFALARTGDYGGMAGIRDQLRAEGFETGQLSGPSLLKQLRDLCIDARRKRFLDPVDDGVAFLREQREAVSGGGL